MIEEMVREEAAEAADMTEPPANEDGESALPDAAEEPETDGSELPEPPDFRAMAEEDLRELKSMVPSLRGLRHLGEMPGALRYAELRELGLSVREAYLAACGRLGDGTRPTSDNRRHLHSTVPKGVSSAGSTMSVGEMEEARRLFSGLPEREILALYRRVSNRN
jgi:hypothetical protein